MSTNSRDDGDNNVHDESEEVRTHFSNIDTDGSGSIDYEEFSRLLRSLGLSRVDDIARLAFESIDINGDNEIDFGEFRTWWQASGKHLKKTN